MTMTKYEKWSVAMAATAIAISALAALRDPLSSLLFRNTPKVFVENQLAIGNRLGNISINPLITVANEGPGEISLGRIEVDMRFPNGEIAKLSSESYYSKNGGNFSLREVTLKAGSTWSERPNIVEVLPQNREDEIVKLEKLVMESAAKNRSSAAITPLTPMIDLFVAMSEMNLDSKSKSEKAAVAARMKEVGRELSKKIELQRAPVSADSEIVSRAKPIFDKNVSRIEKGQYSLSMRIYDRSDKRIWESVFDFLLYEEQVQQFKDSFARFGEVVFQENSPFGYRNFAAPVVVPLRRREQHLLSSEFGLAPNHGMQSDAPQAARA